MKKAIPAYSSMSDEGAEPGDAREHSPDNAEGEELPVLVDHAWVIAYYKDR